MIIALLAIVLAMELESLAVERLRQTAPLELTTSTAREHLHAAYAAGRTQRVDPNLMLAIAHHESRFVVGLAGPERGGLVSCGLMQVGPFRTCRAEWLTLEGSYRLGAERLRAWLDACREGLRCALTGYAGGFTLIRLCRSSATHPSCRIPDRFLARAARIRVG